MTDNLPDGVAPYETPFLIVFAHMILTWNMTEGTMRGLLAQFIGSDSARDVLKSRILTVELGTTGLADALRALAVNILPQDVGKSVSHAVDYFERIRSYRNYYVHGTTNILNATSGPHGFIVNMAAKGKLVEHKDRVSVPDLAFVTDHSMTLRNYVTGISCHLLWTAEFDGGSRPLLPEPPQLPKKLTKTATPLLELFPPPRSSQA